MGKLLVYADDLNILGESLRIIMKNSETLIVASKETGLEINGDKTEYMVMSREQSVGRSHIVKTDNCSFERVEIFTYLGKTLSNENSVQEEIKNRLKSGNACCHSVHNLLSSSLLSNNIKIKIHRTKIFPVALYGCETSSLTLREKHSLRMFENRVLRRIFGPKRHEVTGE